MDRNGSPEIIPDLTANFNTPDRTVRSRCICEALKPFSAHDA